MTRAIALLLRYRQQNRGVKRIDTKNIVLIGMRGSGKTTVGRILAAKLGRELFETDRLIARKAGLSIPEIVDRYGWVKFRAVEKEITNELAGMESVIIDAGGGIVTSEDNVRELRRNGLLVWLNASIDSLLKRTGEDTSRPPLLSGRARWEEVEITIDERKPLYEEAASLVVDTENKTPEEVAGEIMSLLVAQGEFSD